MTVTIPLTRPAASPISKSADIIARQEARELMQTYCGRALSPRWQELADAFNEGAGDTAPITA